MPQLLARPVSNMPRTLALILGSMAELEAQPEAERSATYKDDLDNLKKSWKK